MSSLPDLANQQIGPDRFISLSSTNSLYFHSGFIHLLMPNNDMFKTTVDGNPAAPGMYKTVKIMG